MKPSSLALALAGLSFMMTVIWGGPLLRILRHFKIGKQIRVEEPGRHFTKMGTPTMGGVMIIIPVAMLTILLNAVSLMGLNIFGRSVLVPLFAMLAYGMLGAVDDWQGLYGKRKGEGMRARTKFIVQILLAVGLALSSTMFWMLLNFTCLASLEISTWAYGMCQSRQSSSPACPMQLILPMGWMAWLV
jgi:phospho-N-acetylmuramoyl-pentapeptide-transferase